MEWKTVKLGDILNFRRGHDLPHSEMREGDIPVAGSNGCIGYHNVATPITPIITIGRSGNIGTPYYYEIAWAHNTTLYLDDFKGNNPKYLYYLLKTLPLAAFTGGSAVPTLNRNHIHPLEVLHVDDRATQDKIVAILSSLDDKIENNNRINRNLEAQAQALFKSWFIDFEPWGGTMPEDWKEGSLGDIASFNQRKVGPKFARPIQYLDTGHLTEGVVEGYQRFNPEDKIPSSARRYVGEGDILFSLCRPNMRHYGLMMNPPADIVASTGFAVITASWSGYRYYIYQWLKQDGIIDNIHAVAEQSSTTYPTIDVDYLAGMNMIIPSIEDTEKYALMCRDLYSKMESNYQENLRLAALRDSLLPKLMKGEIAL